MTADRSRSSRLTLPDDEVRVLLQGDWRESNRANTAHHERYATSPANRTRW